jgi:hypothetical protein
LGITQALAVVRRDMSDNDVRIASLVENIYRKGLDDEEKGDAIYKAYKAESFNNIHQIAAFLTFIENHSDELQQDGYFDPIISSHKKTKKGSARGEVSSNKFMDICRRISYHHRYLRQLLALLDEFKDTQVCKTFRKTGLTATRKN